MVDGAKIGMFVGSVLGSIDGVELGTSATCDFEAMLLADTAMHRLEYLIDYGPTLTPDRDTTTGNDLVQVDLSCRAGAVDYLGTYFITS